MKIDIYDYQSEIILDNFRIFKLTYEEQCDLFGLEFFKLGDNKEVHAHKFFPAKRAKLTSLRDYSNHEKRELIGSEYVFLNKKLEDVTFLLEAIRLFKTGFIVATFTEEPNGVTHFHYPRFIKVARFGICKISVKELRRWKVFFCTLKPR